VKAYGSMPDKAMEVFFAISNIHVPTGEY